MKRMLNGLIFRTLLALVLSLTAVVVEGAVLYVAPPPKAAAPAIPAQAPNLSPVPVVEGGASYNAPTSPLNPLSPTSPLGGASTYAPSSGSYPQTGTSSNLQPGQQTGQFLPQSSTRLPGKQPGQFSGQLSGEQAAQPGEGGDASKQGSGGEAIREGQKAELNALPELSAIEKNFSETLNDAQRSTPQKFAAGGVAQFGYSFFRPEGFAPQTDVPVGDDYVVGPGDSIVLTIWGSQDGTYNLEVNRSGEVTLPSIGNIKVAGSRFSKLPDIFRANISKIYKDFKLAVNIGRLRQIKVYLVGEVRSPGDYNVSSMATLINALAAAGGPTRNGSLRNIQIKRNGHLVDTVDLYDFFLNGDKSRDVRLQGGDTVLVPAIGPVAGIVGTIRRPAIYETKGGTTLKGLIDLAGGLLPTTYLQRIQIIRVKANEKVYVLDRNIDPRDAGKSLNELLGAIEVSDQDLVKIFPIDRTPRGYVRLNGYVLRPGDYALKPGMRVADLLKQDNLLPEFNTEYGQIVRLVPPDFHPEVIVFNVNDALAENPVQNHQLQEFDELRIYNRWELEEMPVVRISGEVQRPGAYRLLQKMTVRDLLVTAGNPRQTAYLKSADLTRVSFKDGQVTSHPITVDLAKAFAGDPRYNIPLQNFDELVVHKIPSWIEAVDRHVTLRGEFVFPGVYPIFKGERISSLIRRAGGFTDRAYLPAARFTRELVRELQQKRMDEFSLKSEQELIRKNAELSSVASSPEELTSAKATLEAVKLSLQQLKTLRAEGRVVTRLETLDKFTGSVYDLELLPGDGLEVPQSTNTVSVLGRVVNPTNFVALNGYTVDDYLNLAGGTTRESDEDELYVVRADGSIFSRQQYSWLFGGGFYSEPLTAGATIVVPQRFERTAWMRNIKDITTILAQVALTAGTILLGLK